VKCKICNRDAEENGFCLLHSNAYQNIFEKFAVWKKTSDTSWREYLIEIQKNSLTGVWAKEVATHLFKEGNENVK
jgi:hypothetical protein